MDGIINTQIVWKALQTACDVSPDDCMLIYESQEISYQMVNEISDRVACGLLNLGFKKGDKIGIIGLNQPEWLYTYFAAAKIGAVVTGLSVRYRESELDYILNQSRTRAVLCLTSFIDMNYVAFFNDFKDRIPTVTDFIFMGEGDIGEHLSFDALKATEINPTQLDQAKASVQPDDTMIIIYTSGTTGQPKGALITHKSQMASAHAQAVHTRVSPQDIFPMPLPFNHVGGITCGILTALLGRTTCLLIPMFSPDYVVKQIKKYPVTAMPGVPTIHTLLLMNEEFKAMDHQKVRLVITGGSNADSTLLAQLIETFPNATVMNLYGLSETSGMVIMNSWDSDFETVLHSIGKPIGDLEIKIVDESGHEVAPGETGEICFKGDAVIKEYFDMPEKSKDAFQDGWVLTGDMGYNDKDGNVFLRGRKKEMYLQGGFNVYPVEVENLIASHPKVAMVAGIGVPDDVLGEVGQYYIIPAPGSDPTAEEIKEFCKQRLADYKVPRHIIFRSELPLTPAGKIMKAALKEELT